MEISGKGDSATLDMNTSMENGSVMEGFWLSWLFGALIVLGIVMIAVVVVRAKVGGFSGQVSPQVDNRTQENGHPRAILDERYARGELTSEEYQQRLRALKENR
jgi:putative membrane protein